MKKISHVVSLWLLSLISLSFVSCNPTPYDPTVSSLTEDSTKGISFDSSTGIVELSLLKSLSPAVAERITADCSHLCLNGLEEVSDETAEILASSKCSIEMTSLKTLDNIPLSKKLAQQEGVLLLNEIPELNPEITREVASHSGGLSLNGLTELSEENAAALATHKGPLWLWGLKSMSGKVLKALYDHDGDIYFRDLSDLSRTYSAVIKKKWGFEEKK